MVKKKVSQLRSFSKSLISAKANDVVEYGELWSFVKSKANRVWLWIALCRRTKQVVAYHLGSRTKESFERLYEKVPIDYAGCLSTSDGFEAYNGISKYWHSKSKKKNGRTSQVEAFNTILRQRLARLVKKTCAFSKSEEMHEIVIRWFIQDYNEKILSVGL